MRARHVLPLIGLLLVLSAPIVQGATPPNENDCRNAINAGLDALRNTPPGPQPRDEADRKRLLAEMEALVAAGRRQGLSECETWTRMMGKAFNQ
jgi:hypothetical protein